MGIDVFPIREEGETMCAILNRIANRLRETRDILFFQPTKLLAVAKGKYYTAEQFRAWETGE